MSISFETGAIADDLTATAVAGFNLISFGTKPFQAARTWQEQLARERANNTIGDTLLYGEHPPTLSLGNRANLRDARFAPAFWRARGVEVIRTDRGGEATYHGPGQLIVYPVVSLRGRSYGIKGFVSRGLEAIAQILGHYGMDAYSTLCPAGVWIRGEGHERPVRKIASVGLRIRDGVTLHGFSVNLHCELEAFSFFAPCGIEGGKVTSVQEEIGRGEVLRNQLAERLVGGIAKALG